MIVNSEQERIEKLKAQEEQNRRGGIAAAPANPVHETTGGYYGPDKCCDTAEPARLKTRYELAVQELEMRAARDVQDHTRCMEALDILKKHPEFFDFVRLLRSGLVVLLLMLFAAGTAMAQTPATGTDHGLSGTWGAPTGYSSTLTLNGYTATITPPTGVTGTITVGQCSSTVTTNCIAAAATTFVWKPGGVIYCGTWTISVVADYTDSSGNPQVSAPLTTTVAEACPLVVSPVTGLTGATIP